MNADLPLNVVEDVYIAVVLEGETPEGATWNVYLINDKKEPITNVLISSKGYGFKDGREVKTSVLRHFIGDVDGGDYARVEAIDPQVFGLTNEYWLSYYLGTTIYDKKYIFLPDSIVDEHMTRIPVLDMPGILIGGMENREHMIIAIDGYSSCGKSTLAKALARKLGFVYVDSGAMYRAVTLYFMRQGVDLKDDAAVEAALEAIEIDMEEKGGQLVLLLNGEDVSAEIRQMAVSDMVSEVSTLKRVREELVAQQQAMGRRRNLVMDGRDIGTHVFPKADLKLFMTADPQVRAERRYRELLAKGQETTMEEVVKNLAHRDHIDSTRTESPLVQAEDAVLLDNTHMTEQQQLAFAMEQVRKVYKV